MEKLFESVFTMSLSASVVAAVIILLRPLLRKAPGWLSCGLWILVAARLLCPLTLESPVSLMPDVQPATHQLMALQPALPENSIPQALPQTTVQTHPSHPSIQPDAPAQPTTVTQSSDPEQPFRFHFWMLWVSGIAVMLLYLLVSFLRVRSRVRIYLTTEPGTRECDHIDTPFILGVFRPVVCLPSNLPPESREYVLAHERAHLRRGDHLWKPFGFLLLCLHWFNPVLWLSYILLCRDIELACDEKVIRELDADEKKAYSQALLNCSIRQKFVTACPLAFGEVGVKGRIKSILNYKKPAFWIVLATLLVGIGLGVFFLTDRPKTNSNTPTETEASAAQPSTPHGQNIIREWGDGSYDISCLFARGGTNPNAMSPESLTFQKLPTLAGTVDIRYDGEKFVVRTADGTHHYRYVLYAPYYDGTDRYECVLLSDREDMTYAACQSHRDGLVLFHKKLTYQPTDSYGKVPDMVKQLDRQISGYSFEESRAFYSADSGYALGFSFQETGYFHTTLASDGSYMIARYDYAGNALGSVQSACPPTCFLDFGDGNYAFYAYSYLDGISRLTACNADQTVLWTYDFPISTSISSLLYREGSLYCFGSADTPEQPEDLYFCRLSVDGALLRETTLGGSDRESVFSATVSDSGFAFSGYTQSRDGQLPVKASGAPAYFEAQLSLDLELLSMEKLEQWKGSSEQGYIGSTPLVENLGADWKKLPEHLQNAEAVFPCGDGYVTIQYRQLDNPVLITLLITDYEFCYLEPVYTGYDAQHRPLWQYAGRPHVK